MGRLIDAINKGTYMNVGWEKYPAFYNFLKFVNKVDEDIHKLPEVWIRNAEENLPWLEENKDRVLGSIYDLPEYQDKAIIFVGASPILKKTWHHLKEINDHFIIVAVNSSVKYLLNRGIKPDYVVCIDGVQGTSWSLDLGKRAEDIVGIFSPYAAPTALRDWPGKIRIVPYTHKGSKYKKITSHVRRKWGKGVSSGGNALNAAVAIFGVGTKAKIFLFAGNELCINRSYSAGIKYKNALSRNDLIPHYFSKDVNGKRVRIITPLWTYKLWLETNCETMSPPYVFYNCSEGILGIGPDRNLLPFIRQKSLGDAIQEVKGAFEFEELPWHEKSKIIYNLLYQEDRDGISSYSKSKTSKGMWDFIEEYLYPFKKGLDVGCGKGLGVKSMKDKGLDTYGIDIAPSLEKFWEDNEVTDRCQIASAHDMPFKDNEFDMIACTETLEHIPLHAIDDVLKEIFRVGADKFLFTISKRQDARGGVFLHLLVKPPEWWEAKLEQHGYQVAYTVDRLLSDVSTWWSCFIYAVKDMKPYDSGEKKLTITDDYALFVPFGKGDISFKEKGCRPKLIAV